MTDSKVYLACVPHVPLLYMQDESQNPELWAAYGERIKEFREFDPEVVIIFGGDHYSGVFLNLMPTFMIGHIAEAVKDCGGTPGKLNVPLDLSEACANHLMEREFDVAFSYDLKIDHGFSNALGLFLDNDIDSVPVIPVFINSICNPRPTIKRCRQIGEAIGDFAKSLNKRVAIIGSGGLSHQTKDFFPEYAAAVDPNIKDYIVTGGKSGEINFNVWNDNIQKGMDTINHELCENGFKVPWINEQWDKKFLADFTSGDLSKLDSYKDDEILKEAGYGGGEIRMWVAAAAAGVNAGVGMINMDFYSADTKLAIGAGIAHGAS